MQEVLFQDHSIVLQPKKRQLLMHLLTYRLFCTQKDHLDLSLQEVLGNAVYLMNNFF